MAVIGTIIGFTVYTVFLTLQEGSWDTVRLSSDDLIDGMV